MKIKHCEQHHYHDQSSWENILPIIVAASGWSRWSGGNGFSRPNTGFWGIELVTHGDAHFSQNSRIYSPVQGTIFLLRPGCSNSYEPGPSGVLHKRYLQIRGSAADRLFEVCGMGKSDVLVLTPESFRKVESVLRGIHREFGNWGSESPKTVSEAAYGLLVELSAQRRGVRAENPYVRGVTEWAQRAISQRGGVRECAAALGVSGAHLNRLMKGSTGQSTKEFLTAQKMAAAANALRETDMPVAMVAAQAGFEDPLYFSHAFKKNMGRSPRSYRVWARQYRN